MGERLSPSRPHAKQDMMAQFVFLTSRSGAA